MFIYLGGSKFLQTAVYIYIYIKHKTQINRWNTDWESWKYDATHSEVFLTNFAIEVFHLVMKHSRRNHSNQIKLSRLLGLIRRTFGSKDPVAIKTDFNCVLVRPILEYAFESIQRRATRLICGSDNREGGAYLQLGGLVGGYGAFYLRKFLNLELRKLHFQHSPWDISLKNKTSIRCKMTGTSSAYSNIIEVS